jgi:hypothetical protein
MVLKAPWLQGSLSPMWPSLNIVMELMAWFSATHLDLTFFAFGFAFCLPIFCFFFVLPLEGTLPGTAEEVTWICGPFWLLAFRLFAPLLEGMLPGTAEEVTCTWSGSWFEWIICLIKNKMNPPLFRRSQSACEPS